MNGQKVIAYTCLFGGYDHWPQVPPLPDGVDLYIFTDLAGIPPEPWKISAKNHYPDVTPRRRSRYAKILAHEFLPQHDISIYFDANLRFKQSFVEWAINQVAIEDIAIAPHPKTSCLYDEGAKCIRLGLDDGLTIQRQMDRYKKDGFPAGLGLTENSFIIRRNNLRMARLNIRWWSEYCIGSQRDQLSFMYALWKTDILTVLRSLPVHARDNQFWTQTEHRKSRQVCQPRK
jgi:hypothetical protein